MLALRNWESHSARVEPKKIVLLVMMAILVLFRSAAGKGVIYQKDFMDDSGGWYTYSQLYAPWAELDQYTPPEWKSEWGYIQFRSPWMLDPNHANPGAGYLQLVGWTRMNSLDDGLPESSIDLVDAHLSFKIMIKDLDLKGGHLYFWFQHEYERASIGKYWKRANFALKQYAIETMLTPDTWSEITLPLKPSPSEWICLRASPITKLKYGCVPIEDALRDVNVNFGFIILPVDPNNPASGTICLDDIRIYKAISEVMPFASKGNVVENWALKNKDDKISYGIGMDIGRNLKNWQFDINLDIIKKGIKDAVSGRGVLMTNQEVQKIIPALFEEKINQERQDSAKKLQEKNKREGEAFLAENKKKESIKALPSGLQYEVIKAGTGKKPKLDDPVTIRYRGTLIDGTEFINSYSRGGPVSFRVADTIPGWAEGLQLMQQGAKWKLFIPPNLAFGEYGAQSLAVGPNVTLIFEIELISIIKEGSTTKLNLQK